MENYLTCVYGKETFSPQGLEILFEFLTGQEDFGITPQINMAREQAVMSIYYIERQLTTIPKAFSALEDVVRLYNWFTGQYYDPHILDYVSSQQPVTTPKKAAAIITFFQNKIKIISPDFKQCSICGEWYDASKQEKTDNRTCDKCSDMVSDLRKEINNKTYGYYLIYSDGNSIATTLYPSYESAKTAMDKEYTGFDQDTVEQDASFLSDFGAAIQSEDRYLWEIVQRPTDPDKRILIFSDGEDISYTIYPSYQEAYANMKIAYEGLEDNEDVNKELSYITADYAYLCGADSFTWSIL